ncbi:TAT-variant-translocated molybdopterin oxidoreductase [Balneolaceae bacterium ANBcel3]|nr:TAT-variant-translocated molybdopterin oxidoreductase [Balneolaceae bacterium ANBcel3]
MGKEQPQTYWRSLNELAKNEEYRRFAEREFPENATELTDGLSRRNFLQIMGASVALAGFTACRKPVQKILPYTRQPEHIVPGNPLFYASAMPYRGFLSGVLVETHEGRPTKIEGNDRHPDAMGKSGIREQASILDLYDQDRSRRVRKEGQAESYERFVDFCRDHFSDKSQRIAFISEASSSPTLHRLKNQFLSEFEHARWVTWEPFNEEHILEGTRQFSGKRLMPRYSFEKARAALTLDHDFMQEDSASLAYIRDFSTARSVDHGSVPSRLYSVENNYSLTGSNADHRLRIKSTDIPAFTLALAAQLAQKTSGLEAFSDVQNEFSGSEFLTLAAQDLLENRGSSVVSAGAGQPPAVHAIVAAINLALGNQGVTVLYPDNPYIPAENQNQALSSLVQDMDNGAVDTLVLLGTNPVYTAPSGLNFEEAMKKVPVSIQLANHVDETSRNATWHIPKTHFLESWGDGCSFRGVYSVIQPVIQPLFNSKSEIEFLNTLLNAENKAGYDLVRATWKDRLSSFEVQWDEILHDGYQMETSFDVLNPEPEANFTASAQDLITNIRKTPEDAIELIFKPDPKINDGRFANNGWLQELPDPMTKITWDNVALMSPSTAERIGIPPERSFGEFQHPVLRIQNNEGRALEIAAWVLPGHADDSLTIYAGYGRRHIGRVADEIGVSVYPFIHSTEDVQIPEVSVEVTGQRYEIASTQDHHSLEGRPHVREATLEEFRENPGFASEAVYVPGRFGEREHPVSLFADKVFPDHEPQWGMAIDLNACIGCGVCTIACQAENNIPVIGKREVRRGREMHWIRTDRYFSGDERENPKVMHQPVPCMHCDNAPCEQVCPVAATTHSDDGLNQMTYNRCIGTRYCANNCPFKVRRFNFFNYSKEFLTTGDDPEIVQMAMNPDVTVRFRGVMEKCTFCVQRISRAKIDTKNRTGNSIKPEDGSVVTACQQACPANAISFGDISDNESVVTQKKNNDRNYVMLEEMNIRPRTSYLAKIRNPKPAHSDGH